MIPIILLAEYNRQESLVSLFGEYLVNFDAVYGPDKYQNAIGDHKGSLIMLLPYKLSQDFITRIRDLCESTGNHLVILSEETDIEILPEKEDNPFTWLSQPPEERELKMLLKYYEELYSKRQYTEIENSTGNENTNYEHYHKIFESIQMMPVQGYNESREVIFWNKASELLYGYSRDEAVGRRLEDLIIPESMRNKVIDDISSFASRNIVIPPSELILKNKYGNGVHVFSSHVMITNKNGRKEIYSVDVDLSQVKRHQLIHEVLSEIASATNTSDDLQEFLKVLKESLSKIINTRNFFIALYDEEDNSLTLPIFVDDIDQFKTFPAGRTLTAHMISQNKPLLLKEKEMIALEEKDVIDRVGSSCKLWLGVPLRSEDKVMGAIVLQSYTDDTVYDETDMKTLQIVAEQISIAIDRKARQEELKESERALKTLISNLPGIAYRCRPDRSRTMEFLSDGFTTLTGYDVEEFTGNRKYCYSELIHADHRDEVRKNVNHAIKNDQPYYLVYRLTVKGGIVKWVWEKGTAVNDNHGRPMALEGFIIDITDRIEMEKLIISAKEQAEESDRLKSAFLSNLSHEIRSPMNRIVGYSQLLKAEEAGEPISQYIDIIFKSSKQLLDVINDIVDMARLDSGQMRIQKKEFDPVVILSNIKAHAEEQLLIFGQKQHKITVFIHHSIIDISVNSDMELVSKALMHLVNNAVKFTEQGSIEIGYDMVDNNFVRFFVCDTGIGISQDNQSLIFDRFRQADDRITRKYEGAGLGLSISKGITDLLGGTIWVESSEGKGSRFYITIPVS